MQRPAHLDVETLRWVREAIMSGGVVGAPLSTDAGEVVDWLAGVLAALDPDPAREHGMPLADDVDTVLREWREIGATGMVAPPLGDLARAAVGALMRRRRIARRWLPEPVDPLLADVRAMVSRYYDQVPTDVSTAEAVRALGRAYRAAHAALVNRSREGARVDTRTHRLLLAERVCIALTSGCDGDVLDLAIAGWKAATDPPPTGTEPGA